MLNSDVADQRSLAMEIEVRDDSAVGPSWQTLNSFSYSKRNRATCASPAPTCDTCT